jgi:hypothetical protein
MCVVFGVHDAKTNAAAAIEKARMVDIWSTSGDTPAIGLASA